MSPLPWLLLLTPTVAASTSDPFVEWKGTPESGFGRTYGVSVADVDGDGWADLVNPFAHSLWLNDAAKGFTLVDIPELDAILSQYGGSLGDYDADGLPDLSSEPRGVDSILLHNEGGGDFRQLDIDHFPAGPAGKYPGQYAETDGWIDADGDGYLDLFVPAYYGSSGFYQNLGPDKTGDYMFEEMALDIGIVLSTTSSLRPEGAQFVDIDRDGDPDLYVCGQLLRNVSTPGDPFFEGDNGGIPEEGFDEGAAFADIDMDGDFDLGVFYNGIYWKSGLPTGYGFLVWQNLGDGTFVLLDPDSIEDYDISAGGGFFGMSFIDWDNDGDLDLSFGGSFEQNRWREIGVREFAAIDTVVAKPYALPAWFDWDLDGNLDVGVGGWGGRARLYTNSLYDSAKEGDRQFVRVRPVADSAIVADGVDTEFGATVDVHVAGEAPDVRRRNFTASGHGYLNQSEYALTFGLEGLTAPLVDVSVDFANPSDEGLWRVDKYVNPALGDIDVDTLALPREVRVFRSGDVEINGKRYGVGTDETPLLETPGGLSAPSIDDDLAALDVGTWVGLEVSVPVDKDPDRGAAIREVVVDGVLGAPVKCDDASGNVLVWDVTAAAKLVAGSSGAVLPDNRRVDVPTDFELENGHTYRVMALVTDARTFVAGKSSSWLEVTGALDLVAKSPCDPKSIAGAVVGSGERSMAVRWRERVVVPEVPKDTGDTGTTGDTGADDSGTTKDDSGTPKTDDTGGPSTDTGENGGAGENGGGCACASEPNLRSGLWLLFGVPLILRRRHSKSRGRSVG